MPPAPGVFPSSPAWNQLIPKSDTPVTSREELSELRAAKLHDVKGARGLASLGTRALRVSVLKSASQEEPRQPRAADGWPQRCHLSPPRPVRVALMWQKELG